MTANRSIAEVLASLEAQTAFHREREAFHAKHEKSPREQRELHGAELEAATRRLEAFKAAAAEALDHLDRAPASQPQQDLKKQDLGTALRPRMGRMVTAHIADGVARAKWRSTRSWPATSFTRQRRISIRARGNALGNDRPNDPKP